MLFLLCIKAQQFKKMHKILYFLSVFENFLKKFCDKIMMNNIIFYGISWFIELLFLPIWFYRKIDTLFCNSSLGNGKEVRTWHNFVIFAYLNYIMNFSKVNVRDLAKAKYEDTYLLRTTKFLILLVLTFSKKIKNLIIKNNC